MLRLGLHPHPHLLPSREKGPEGDRDARFLRRQEPRTQPFRPSAPCALRCRARWIPAFAGMTARFAGTTYATNVKVGVAMGQWAVVVGWGGQNAGMRGSAKTGTSGTTLPPLRPVCAPLSRTLDSSLRWNDGSWRGNRRSLRRNVGHNPSAPAPRVRSAVAHAGFQPSLE